MGAVAFERGLVGHWPMDERSGATAYDQSPYGNNGAIYGAVFTRGKLGWALDFDGVDDYVKVPDDPSLDFGSTNFSVSIWFKTTSLDRQRAIRKMNPNSPYDGWIITSRFSDDDGLRWAVRDVDGDVILIYKTGWFDGEWHHTVMVRDGDTLKAYVDGSLVGSDTNSAVDSSYYSGPLQIGGSAQFWSGSIDEVRIYDRALSESEIKDLYYYGAEPSTKMPPVSRARV